MRMQYSTQDVCEPKQQRMHEDAAKKWKTNVREKEACIGEYEIGCRTDDCILHGKTICHTNFSLGLQKSKSVLTQLLTCFNFRTKALDQEELTKVSYIDFKKVFDNISHIKLVEVLTFSVYLDACLLG